MGNVTSGRSSCNTIQFADPNNGGMASEIFKFVDNIKSAIGCVLDIKADFDRILICGMGGSAIGGDIIRDCVIGDLKCFIAVQRFPELPKWVNEKTFVIISSYSGNTSETLSMYSQAVRIGCPIVTLTSGGKLEQLSNENGNMLIKMEAGFQPRSALGFNLGYMANIIDTLCGTKCRDEIRRLIPSLYKFRDRLKANGSISWKIANRIDNRTPIIYATAGIYASAIRWKSQINENSKMMSFTGSVPEFNHNEIAGWSEGELRGKCVSVFLYEVNASRDIRRMADTSIAALKRYNQDAEVVQIKGKTPLERTLRAVMIGDYVSLYLASLRNVDPMDIASILEFKHRL